MGKLECDVLVVGGGPAGSSAARVAAENGAKTVLIEKLEKPGKIACGEALGVYLTKLLDYKIPSNLIKWKCDGIQVHLEDLQITNKGNYWDSYSVERKEFDPWLLKKAESAGAQIMTSTELMSLNLNNTSLVNEVLVVHNGEKSILKPRVLIASDGMDSRVMHLLGLYSKRESRIVEVCGWEMENVNLPDPHLEHVFIGEYAGDTYSYIFPKDSNRANVGVGTLESSKSLNKKFLEFTNLPIVKNMIKNATKTVDRSGKIIISSNSSTQFKNVLFAGDSAAQNLQPFIEGILPGMICGEEAGYTAAKHVKEMYSLNSYSKRIFNRIGEHFELSDNIASALAKISKLDNNKRFLIQFGVFSGKIELNEIDKWARMTKLEVADNIKTLTD